MIARAEFAVGQSVRSEFPILATDVRGKPLVYLDNAATAQKPQAVLSACDSYYRKQNANIHRGVHHLSQIATAEFDRARGSVQRLLNAGEADEVIFTKGCTEAINLVASGMCWGTEPKFQPGDGIIVSTLEHHSNIVPWQLAAERTGAKIHPIPITDDGEIQLDAYLNLLKNARPRLVAIKHVCNALGTINPIKWMIEQAHAYGALVMVDGAQAGPHLRIDVQDLDADFYTLSCHKIYAPTGVGVLYGKRALLESLPPYHGGGDMIRTVAFEGSTYAPIPAKFEAGTPNIEGVIGLGSAIEWLTEVGGGSLEAAFEAIGSHESALRAQAEALLSEIPGVRVVGRSKDKTGIVSFVVQHAHPHDIGTILDTDGIAIRAGHHCCMPLMTRLGIPATARASFALYNTEDEVEQLAKSVQRAKEMFA
jgi:cysteine desulfurase/selenocysteine lyase